VDLNIVEERKEGVLLLHLTGEITKPTGDHLLRWRPWEEGLGNQAHVLLINFTGITYINSAGMAALIRLARLGARGNYRTGCYGLHYHYEKLFTMVGLTRYMEVYPSEWAAIERIGS
jgi:anti-anti-sigma factor